MVNCEKGKHDFGSGQPFCVLCAAPNPRCVTCGRRVDIEANGSTRCVKGHTFRFEPAAPPVEVRAGSGWRPSRRRNR